MLVMDARQYQMVEARLLFAMLRARKQYRGALRNIDDRATLCGGAGYSVGISISRFMTSGARDCWQDAEISVP